MSFGRTDKDLAAEHVKLDDRDSKTKSTKHYRCESNDQQQQKKNRIDVIKDPHFRPKAHRKLIGQLVTESFIQARRQDGFF